MNENTQNTQNTQNLKITLIGDSSVGKTSLITRLFYNIYNASAMAIATIGASFFTGVFNASNKQKFKLQVWDTAGQERFRSLIPMYIRGADIILYVYDLSDMHSFNSLVNFWVKKIRKEYFEEEPLHFLIGTKSDLLNEKQLDDIVNSLDLYKIDDVFFEQFFIVSSLNGNNTENLITKMLDIVVKKNIGKNKDMPSIVSLETYESDGLCCG